MKTQVIHRHEAKILGLTTITAPSGARVLSAVPRLSQPGWNVYLLHGTEEGAPTEEYTVASIKTGVPIPEGGCVWIATLPALGLHIFALTATAKANYLDLYPDLGEIIADHQ